MKTIKQTRIPKKLQKQFMYVKVEETEKICSDQTVRFLITPGKGNNYTMVLCAYHPNAEIAEPIKRRTEGEIFKTSKSYKNISNNKD